MGGLRSQEGTRAALLHRARARKRPSSPGAAYSVLTLAMAVLVGALALSSRQAPPPTIAEFAPRAVEQVTDTSGDAADAGGAAAARTDDADQGAGSSAARSQAIDVARVRQCVGDPPRQIEDPQSPPCVPYWSGDNGGATSRGVTRDEIRVVTYFNPALVAFFNSRFEFYGRQIRVLPWTVPGDNGEGDRAAARTVYEQDRAFAVTTAGDNQWAYLDELARYGVVGVWHSSNFNEPYLESRRPYLWTYTMANDREFALLGDWYCARFAGRDAVHAGDPVLQMTRRKPGIILANTEEWEGTSAEPMNARLAACGGRAEVIRANEQTYDPAYYAPFMEAAVLQMKSSGVTTVTCLCWGVTLGIAMRAATNQGYFPEWLVTSFINNEATWFHRPHLPHYQREHLLYLLANPMQRGYPDHPSNWAMHESNGTGYPPSSAHQWWLDTAYWTLLLLSSGIQMAGPHLTPATFERALHRTRFPNSPHRIKAGAVGFGDGDHSMTDDAAELWWSNTIRDPYGDMGTFCYVDGGARRRLGEFPADDPFFAGPCDNGST